MPNSEESLSLPAIDPAGGLSPDHAARIAGAVLIFTAITTVIAVGARVAAGADQPTLLESLAAISANKGLYSVGGAARLVSGLALMAGAWFMYRTWTIRRQWAGQSLPILFGLSGAFTAASGLCAVALAASVGPSAEAASAVTAGAPEEAWIYARWLTGKIGFTLAGAALIAAACSQWKSGGTLKPVSLVSAVIGIAMLFIWLDAATAVHRISGVAFVVWLAALGAVLLTGRWERRSTGTVR